MKKQAFCQNWTCNGKTVTLPHDAQISEGRGADVSNGGHGYFPGGIYTYEKTFTAPNEWKGKTILIEFEGIYRNATVSLNGKEIAFHAYGYKASGEMNGVCCDCCLYNSHYSEKEIDFVI